MARDRRCSDSKAQIAAERKAELDALKQRATHLANEILMNEMRSVPRPQVGGKQDSRRAWDKLLADFDQWAQRFHAPTQSVSLPASVPTVSGGHVPKHYPLVAEGPPGIAGYFCLKNFTQSTASEFVYRCYRE
jgi:hypothetical protein